MLRFKHLNHFVMHKHLILIGPHNSRSAHLMFRNVIYPLFALSIRTRCNITFMSITAVACNACQNL